MQHEQVAAHNEQTVVYVVARRKPFRWQLLSIDRAGQFHELAPERYFRSRAMDDYRILMRAAVGNKY